MYDSNATSYPHTRKITYSWIQLNDEILYVATYVLLKLVHNNDDM